MVNFTSNQEKYKSKQWAILACQIGKREKWGKVGEGGEKEEEKRDL